MNPTTETTDVCPHCQENVPLRHWTVHALRCEWEVIAQVLAGLDSVEARQFAQHVAAGQQRAASGQKGETL